MTRLCMPLVVCLVRTHDKDLPSIPAQSLDVAALKCCATVEDEEGMVSVEVLDAEFFDENILVIVFRPSDRGRGELMIWAPLVSNMFLTVDP